MCRDLVLCSGFQRYERTFMQFLRLFKVCARMKGPLAGNAINGYRFVRFMFGKYAPVLESNFYDPSKWPVENFPDFFVIYKIRRRAEVFY